MHRTHVSRAHSQRPLSSKPSDETNRNRIGRTAKCMQRIVMGLSVWCIWTRWSCRYRPVMCRICDCAKVNMLQLTGRNVRGTAFSPTLLYTPPYACVNESMHSIRIWIWLQRHFVLFSLRLRFSLRSLHEKSMICSEIHKPHRRCADRF